MNVPTVLAEHLIAYLSTDQTPQAQSMRDCLQALLELHSSAFAPPEIATADELLHRRLNSLKIQPDPSFDNA